MTGFELVNVDGKLVARNPDSGETFPLPLGEISPESSRIGPEGNKYPFEVEADTGDLVVGGGSNLVLPHPEAEIGDERRTLLYEGGHFERIELEGLTLHQSDPVMGAGNAVSVARDGATVYGARNDVSGEGRISVYGDDHSICGDEEPVESLVVAGHDHSVEGAADCVVVDSEAADVAGSSRSVLVGGGSTLTDGEFQTVCGYASEARDDHATVVGSGSTVDAEDGVALGFDVDLAHDADGSVAIGADSVVDGAEGALLVSPGGGSLETDGAARLEYDQLERGAVAGTFDDADRQPGTVVEEIDEEADELVFRAAYGDGEVKTGRVSLS